MKNIFLKLTIVYLIIFLSFSAKADWTKVTVGSNGHVFYVDKNKITENDGYVYFWELIDYLNVNEHGDLSAKIYIEGDCKNFKFKWVSLSYHKDAMGRDNTKVKKPSKVVSGWQTPEINSTSKKILKYVCDINGITL